MTERKILLLAGTGDARRIAATLVARGLPVIASLKGLTKDPAPYPCPVRTGGFGGAEGLLAWLRAAGISAIIDATHPFADQMSSHARLAAAAADIPLAINHRPPWQARPEDDWQSCADLESAVAALPRGARAFFATGRGGLETISARRDIWAALRVVDPPRSLFPGNGEYIVARPPFDIDAEKALFALLGITHVVAKNAGGGPARAKLDAAAALGLPVLLVERRVASGPGPDPVALPVAELADWAAARLSEQATQGQKGANSL